MIDDNHHTGGVVEASAGVGEVNDLLENVGWFFTATEVFGELVFTNHAGDAIAAKEVAFADFEWASRKIDFERRGLADAACEGVAMLLVDPDEFAFGATGPSLVFHRMIHREAFEVATAQNVTTGVTHVGKAKTAIAEESVSERRANTEMRAQTETKLGNSVVGLEGNEFEVGRIRGITNEFMYLINSTLGGFSTTGKSSDAIRDTVKAQSLVAHEAVFILAANAANVGECGATKLHEIG
jgi:hypothetical protein